jgi:hypothetical protein
MSWWSAPVMETYQGVDVGSGPAVDLMPSGALVAVLIGVRAAS